MEALFLTILAVLLLYIILLRREKRHKRHAIPLKVKQAVWRRDGGRCRHCGSKYYLEYDHVKPWSRGGDNSVNNLQLLCRACNEKKGNRYVG